MPFDRPGQRPAEEARWCERCDVSVDLHPNFSDDEEWECEMAGLKADQIDRFFGAFG